MTTELNVNKEMEEVQDTMNQVIQLFKNATASNCVGNVSKHKIGAAFIGIKTNISGKHKLHIYVLLFPFTGAEFGFGGRYNEYKEQNLFLMDTSFVVDMHFYRWVYDEMKRTNDIVMMEFDLSDRCFTVASSDALIRKRRDDKNKTIIAQEFDEWYETASFKDTFLIEITHPYLYMVPFPVQPFLFKTGYKTPLLRCEKA